MEATIVDIEQKALTLPGQAHGIVVIDQATFKSACDFREIIKEFESQINTEYDDVIRKWHEGHKLSIEKKKKAMAPVVEAKGINNVNIGRWLTNQENIRKQEEFRLAEVARKSEEEAKIAEAAAYEAAGDTDTANEIINEPIKATSVVLPKATLNTGINMRETWSAKVVNLMDLVRAIADKKVPVAAVDASMVYLNGMARIEKAGLNIPGVEAVSKKSIY